MQKKIIEEPIFETVQTGVHKKEIWVTSDGKAHDNEEYAEQHEFYVCKVNQRSLGLPYHEVILDCYCKEDLERYENDYTYNVSYYDYDKDKLTFPCTYVLVEEDESDYSEDIHGYPEIHLRIYTVEEYKKNTLDKLNQIATIE